MADRNKQVPENVAGEFFVDSTCIDCDTCRQLAPATFAEATDYSYVHRQPETAVEQRAALQALVACPTASIGARSPAREATRDFPMQVEAEVSYCGFYRFSGYVLNNSGDGSGSIRRLRPQDGSCQIDQGAGAKRKGTPRAPQFSHSRDLFSSVLDHGDSSG